MHLGRNECAFDSDEMLTILIVLFGTRNQVVCAILFEIEIVRNFRKGKKLDRNSVDSFKSCNLFHEKCLEVPTFHLNGKKRSKHIKLVFCEDNPDSTRKQSLKGDEGAGPPNVLG